MKEPNTTNHLSQVSHSVNHRNLPAAIDWMNAALASIPDVRAATALHNSTRRLRSTLGHYSTLDGVSDLQVGHILGELRVLEEWATSII